MVHERIPIGLVVPIDTVVAELLDRIHRIGLMPGQQRAQPAHERTGRVD
jgi:hypothetical protein